MRAAAIRRESWNFLFLPWPDGTKIDQIFL